MPSSDKHKQNDAHTNEWCSTTQHAKRHALLSGTAPWGLTGGGGGRDRDTGQPKQSTHKMIFSADLGHFILKTRKTWNYFDKHFGKCTLIATTGGNYPLHLVDWREQDPPPSPLWRRPCLLSIFPVSVRNSCDFPARQTTQQNHTRGNHTQTSTILSHFTRGVSVRNMIKGNVVYHFRQVMEL